MQLGLWPGGSLVGASRSLHLRPAAGSCLLAWAMTGPWLLLLLALGCPALPTDVGGTPFPSLAPPITLLVDGKQQTLVVCLVLDVAPPGLDSSIWFSAGNGSTLDAFTYGPSPAADGTWTSLAQLSLPSEESAAWEPVVCHSGPGPGGQSRSTQPLQLSGGASTARTCFLEPLRGTPSQALRLGVLRLLLCKLLLLDVLLTYGHLFQQLPPDALVLGDCGTPGRSTPRLREPRSPGCEEETSQGSPSDLGVPSNLRAFFARDLPPPLYWGWPALGSASPSC